MTQLYPRTDLGSQLSLPTFGIVPPGLPAEKTLSTGLVWVVRMGDGVRVEGHRDGRRANPPPLGQLSLSPHHCLRAL